jgi:hypothetical protein
MYASNPIPRFVAGAMLAAFVMTGVGMSSANAEQAAKPPAAASSPGQLLQQNPKGGPPLASAVQQLALSNPTTFPTLIGLLANANELQKSAIAQGLTQAAKIEVLTNQALAQDWQNQIATVTDPTFKTAASDALGDVRLGSVGGAAGGSTGAGLGGPGGGGGGGGGTPQPIGTGGTPAATTAFTFTGSTTGSSGVPTTTANSVSSTR